MGFDNLVIVFVCSIATNSMPKMFDFSTVSTFWEIILDCVIGFDKLEVVLGLLPAAGFILLLFGFYAVFDSFWIFSPLFLKNN